MKGPTPILFLDLDGTVRHGKEQLGHFISGPADVEIFDGVVDRLKYYKSRGWRIVAISNQGGIALGHVAENDVARAMQETQRMCANLFDRIMWCPHHPDAIKDDADNQCMCRKPRIGNVVRAMMGLSQQFKDEYYQPASCLFVGDRDEDMACAESANIPFMLAEDWRKQKLEE